jgi:hypothetical protein
VLNGHGSSGHVGSVRMTTPLETASIPDARPPRTLSELLNRLPNRQPGNLPLLELDSLPSDFLPELQIPGLASESPPGDGVSEQLGGQDMATGDATSRRDDL